MAGGSSGSSGADAVSITILILLMFISCVLIGYVSLFLYTRYKKNKDEHYPGIEFFQSSWLDGERKPLIPGSVHTRTVQPMMSDSDDPIEEHETTGSEEADFKERDFSKLGRIIFVMRYHKKREELMVRLVQIEGLPVSQELYSPHSAYVDVQLKYTGSPNSINQEVQKPPRLDICLQQVYYFIISTQQMMSHSLEFQINTFDDHYRRYVSGMVEVNLCEELGDDILTGNEVVFVKEILEPFRFSGSPPDNEEHDDGDDFVSAVSDITNEREKEKYHDQHDDIPPNEPIGDAIPQTAEERSVSSSLASSHESLASNMSWEPEVSTDLLSTSMNSLYYRCTSEMDLTTLNPLTSDKRSHSVGYLPTYEWTVTDIPIDDEEPQTAVENVDEKDATKTSNTDYYKIYDDDQLSDNENQANHQPPPESFYTLVPVTPLHPKKFDLLNKIETISDSGIYISNNSTAAASTRKVAIKKQSKLKKQKVGRTLSINRRHDTLMKSKRLGRNSSPPLERSSSWPRLVPDEDTSTEASPVHLPKVKTKKETEV